MKNSISMQIAKTMSVTVEACCSEWKFLEMVSKNWCHYAINNDSGFENFWNIACSWQHCGWGSRKNGPFEMLLKQCKFCVPNPLLSNEKPEIHKFMKQANYSAECSFEKFQLESVHANWQSCVWCACKLFHIKIPSMQFDWSAQWDKSWFFIQIVSIWIQKYFTVKVELR